MRKMKRSLSRIAVTDGDDYSIVVEMNTPAEKRNSVCAGEK